MKTLIVLRTHEWRCDAPGCRTCASDSRDRPPAQWLVLSRPVYELGVPIDTEERHYCPACRGAVVPRHPWAIRSARAETEPQTPRVAEPPDAASILTCQTVGLHPASYCGHVHATNADAEACAVRRADAGFARWTSARVPACFYDGARHRAPPAAHA